MYDSFSWMNVPEFTSLLATDRDSITHDKHLCNADDVVLNPGVGGATLATDEVSSKHYQIIKIAHGALDSVTLVSTASGLPVDLRTNNAGTLDVNLAAAAATVTVTGTITANAGTGTLTVQDTASLVDDAAFSPGSSRVLPAGYVFDDVTPDTINEGDIGVARISANRNLYTQLRDAAGNERGANVTAGGALNVAVDSVAGTVTVTGAVTNTVLSVVGGGTEATAQRVTIANDSTGVLSVDDNGASLTVDGTVTANAGTGTFTVAGAVTNTVLSVVGGGTEAAAQRVTIANNSTGVVGVTGTVAISSMPNEGQATMANSISVAIASDQANVPVSQATASALNAQVVGTIAHDSADSGNPVKVGGVARTANPTAVTAGDRVDMFMDDLGKQVVYPIAPRDRIVAGARVSLTSTTETTILAAGGASVFRDLVMLMLSNESATECRVDIRDVTAGTVMFSIDLASDGGGAVIPFRVPWPQATANSAWTAQCSAGVSTVYVSCLGVENN